MSGKGTARADSWREGLRDALSPERGPADLVGVGNPIRGDDGAGLEVVSRLRARPGAARRLRIHPPASMPERLLSKLASGGHKVVVFDAVESGLPPGGIVCRKLGSTRYGFFATHNVPLKLVPGLESRLDDFHILGIQPGSLEVGEGLSTPVKEAVEEVVSFIRAGAGDTG